MSSFRRVRLGSQRGWTLPEMLISVLVFGFVHRLLTESGTGLRGRGGATRGRAKAH